MLLEYLACGERQIRHGQLIPLCRKRAVEFLNPHREKMSMLIKFSIMATRLPLSLPLLQDHERDCHNHQKITISNLLTTEFLCPEQVLKMKGFGENLTD